MNRYNQRQAPFGRFSLTCMCVRNGRDIVHTVCSCRIHDGGDRGHARQLPLAEHGRPEGPRRVPALQRGGPDLLAPEPQHRHHRVRRQRRCHTTRL